MTEAEKEAQKQGQSTQSQSTKKIEMVVRSPEDLQAATRVQVEYLSDNMSNQIIQAVVTRSAEKVALGTLQKVDGIVEDAIGHLTDFLPVLLQREALTSESEFKTDIQKFKALMPA